jgi:CRP-like cAMP-binding protein
MDSSTQAAVAALKYLVSTLPDQGYAANDKVALLGICQRLDSLIQGDDVQLKVHRREKRRHSLIPLPDADDERPMLGMADEASGTTDGFRRSSLVANSDAALLAGSNTALPAVSLDALPSLDKASNRLSIQKSPTSSRLAVRTSPNSLVRTSSNSLGRTSPVSPSRTRENNDSSPEVEPSSAGSIETQVLPWLTNILFKKSSDDLVEGSRAPKKLAYWTQCRKVLLRWFSRAFEPIHPHDTFCFRWNLVVMALTIYTAIILPCRLGYNTEPGPFNIVVDYLTELVFLADVYLSFRFGYVLPQKQGHGVEMDRGRICRHYTYTWAGPDVVASIPIDFISVTTGMPLNNYGFMKVLRMLKLFRLLRLLHLKFLERLEKEGGNLQASMIRLCKLLVAFFFTIHFIGCSYWSLRRSEIEDGSTLWAAADDSSDEEVASFINRYSMGCYWALLVIIGSDTQPASQTQRFFTIASMIIGVCVFSLIIGAASSLLVTLDAHAAAREEQIDSIVHFMVFRKVPRALQRKIVQYYDFLWLSGQSNYHKNLFSELSESLSVQLEIVLKRQMISDTLLFQTCSRTTILAVMRCLETVVVSPDELVLRQGDEGNAMYFVGFGELRVTVNDADGLAMVLHTIKQGDHFGEIALLSHSARKRTVNIQAVSFCQLDSLSREDFKSIEATCPDFSAELRQLAARKVERSNNAEKSINALHKAKDLWKSKAQRKRKALVGRKKKRSKAGFGGALSAFSGQMSQDGSGNSRVYPGGTVDDVAQGRSGSHSGRQDSSAPADSAGGGREGAQKELPTKVELSGPKKKFTKVEKKQRSLSRRLLSKTGLKNSVSGLKGQLDHQPSLISGLCHVAGSQSLET